ncbi:MAG: Gfo/Idh/MocA family oxidoreductase [Verrucomicrobiota bacterium]|nr:Gfo/Idh/MocA family oxidoreductase [Verrucomicrobiota bacterium]
MSSTKYRALLAGCGRMGASQAAILSTHADLSLAAVCDISLENATKVGAEHNVPAFTDFSKALAETKPDVVVICSSNTGHAPLTLEAVRFGVKGIYCEKPMATNLADARAMVSECKARNTFLVINHQRRVSPDLVEIRRMIEAGAIGSLRTIRTQNQGDILSDGTHAVDSLMFFLGDKAPEWVFGQLHRDLDALKKQDAQPGFRYGHVVESGGTAVIGFPNGIRAECTFGDLCAPRTPYQDFVIEGDKGRIWRTGDGTSPNVFLDNGQPGDHAVGIDQWMYKPIPAQPGQHAPWKGIPVEKAPKGGGITISYALFAKSIREGCDHPMSGERALRGFEIIMAIYESARLHKKLSLPLQQERFPLEIMVEKGQV